MKSKTDIFNLYREGKTKYVFTLAWYRFLTYAELETYDHLEAYDVEVGKRKVKSKNDWNKLVIPYNEDNVKKALYIALDKAIMYFNMHMDDVITMDYIYYDDIKAWLYILDCSDFDTAIVNTKEDIKSFYNEVVKKFKFDIVL